MYGKRRLPPGAKAHVLNGKGGNGGSLALTKTAAAEAIAVNNHRR